MTGLRYQSGHQVQLLVGGRDYFPALVRAMNSAQHEIRIESYIFNVDPSGTLVLEAMLRAARRGIQVYLVVDAIGTPPFNDDWAERLRAAGVHWIRYLPLGAFGWMIPGRWRRLHRKLCVIDAECGFCGGINVVDDYLELGRGWQDTPRLDFALQIKGPVVRDMWQVMEQFWRRLRSMQALEQGRLLEAHADLMAPAVVPQEQSALSRPNKRSGGGSGAGSGVGSGAGPGAGVSAALVLRDNVRHRRQIERTYRQAIAHAQHEVLIANAYFMPGKQLRTALIHAARRGVRVRLLLAGRYEFFMQQHAGIPLWSALLAAGVEIFEYQQGFLHAKVAVVDSRWVTVGSSNLDPLSLLMAREANVAVSDTQLASMLQFYIRNAMEKHSVQVLPAAFSRRNWRLRLNDWLAYALLRLSMLLTGNNY